MRTPSFIPAVGRLVVISAAVLVTACGSTGGVPRHQIYATLDSLKQAEGPRVSLTTQHDPGSFNRISARLRLQDDAYVAVVNVAPAGYASIVFPEDPKDNGFLRGGRSYVIPSFFPGWASSVVPPSGATGSRFVWFGNSFNSRVGTRGPGYIFVVASWKPIDFDLLLAEGYFDERDLGTSLRELEPKEVISDFARLGMTDSTAAMSADVARYSGYDMAAGMYAYSARNSSYYCNLNARGLGFSYYGLSNFGYLNSMYASWDGFDRCLDNPAYFLDPGRWVAWRPPVRPVKPDSTGADSTGTDSTGTDTTTAPGSSDRRPDQESLLGRRRSIPAIDAVDLPIAREVELTKEERREMRRRGETEPSGRDEGWGDNRPGRAGAGGRASRSGDHERPTRSNAGPDRSTRSSGGSGSSGGRSASPPADRAGSSGSAGERTRSAPSAPPSSSGSSGGGTSRGKSGPPDTP